MVLLPIISRLISRLRLRRLVFMRTACGQRKVFFAASLALGEEVKFFVAVGAHPTGIVPAEAAAGDGEVWVVVGSAGIRIGVPRGVVLFDGGGFPRVRTIHLTGIPAVQWRGYTTTMRHEECWRQGDGDKYLPVGATIIGM